MPREIYRTVDIAKIVLNLKDQDFGLGHFSFKIGRLREDSF